MKVKNQEDEDSVPLSKVWWHEKVAVRSSFLSIRCLKPLKVRSTETLEAQCKVSGIPACCK
jgi:hypothetical protein